MGELTFDFHPINLNILNNVRNNKIVNENEILYNKAQSSSEIRAAEHVNITDKETVKVKTAKDDCLYKFPEKTQVEALLSDMMNQLTKIFVRAFDYMGRREAPRNGKRFKIVSQKYDSRFFEQAYKMMSKEYRQSMNAITDISRLSGHNPCHHQTEAKEIWRNLLEHSKSILKRAAVRCVSDFLRTRNRADDSRAKEKVGQLLLREINEVRSNQLKVLCDDFKLCYKDLLH